MQAAQAISSRKSPALTRQQPVMSPKTSKMSNRSIRPSRTYHTGCRPSRGTCRRRSVAKGTLSPSRLLTIGFEYLLLPLLRSTHNAVPDTGRRLAGANSTPRSTSLLPGKRKSTNTVIPSGAGTYMRVAKRRDPNLKRKLEQVRLGSSGQCCRLKSGHCPELRNWT